MQFQRQTAVPCRLSELKDGRWVQQPDRPAGIETSRGVLTRVNVFGTVVEKQPTGFLVDDGTTAIAVRDFDPEPQPVQAGIGDLVLVIGKPREYQGEKYIILEICKRLANSAWLDYRKKELELFPIRQVRTEVKAPEKVEVPEGGNPFEAIIGKVRELDTGNGADVQEVLSAIDNPEKDRLLQSLIEEGELFENRPGKVKVLE